MNKKHIPLVVALVVIVGAWYWVFGLPRVANLQIPTSPEAIARGEYLAIAGGCVSCHKVGDAEGMTGGYQIESPYGGTFYAPNITPDEETGIGGWTGRDFLLAMKHGRSPDGGFYWPAFPYRSYNGMSDEDVLDLAAYLMAQPAIASEVPDHDLPVWQFSWMMAGWNMMANWLEGDLPAIPADPEIERGAYLVRHLNHCGECHTPRNALGMMDLSREFEGSEIVSADISPRGLRNWSADDFDFFLDLGMTASGDFVGGEMEHVITDNTSRLSAEDRMAMARFFTRPVE